MLHPSILYPIKAKAVPIVLLQRPSTTSSVDSWGQCEPVLNTNRQSYRWVLKKMHGYNKRESHYEQWPEWACLDVICADLDIRNGISILRKI